MQSVATKVEIPSSNVNQFAEELVAALPGKENTKGSVGTATTGPVAVRAAQTSLRDYLARVVPVQVVLELPLLRKKTSSPPHWEAVVVAAVVVVPVKALAVARYGPGGGNGKGTGGGG